ncbi:MAG: phosphoadenosine phosphosulfate reductase [Lachnospiraceae bacterium]|nr:phosphoadenosine phosphosulfate reductase [Lachnospiraceae bacterium]
MKHIAQVSGGKDSLAQVLFIVETGLPLDEVVYFNNGMDFSAIANTFKRLKPILEERGVGLVELRPENDFLYDMLERPVESEQKGKHNGYGWCGGVCRWGTSEKIATLDKYARGAVQYIGIAADEEHRRAELTGNKRSILIEKGITEGDCLTYCRDRGWNWNEPTPMTESGFIDLYDILDRVSCWCCSNKNIKELYNIYRYLPDYWERLKKLQAQLARPMKKYACKQYGEYGNLFDLEKVFRAEEKNPTNFYKRYLNKGGNA